ncbi:MAG: hypothetical protein PHU85_07410 [Phycisphaerae bacterium]|nr:hypothetical protein [Phycisphaerae bacterium]
MSEFESLFDACLPVDPLGGQIDSQLAAVADKPAVYLLATEDRQPILLASGLAVRTILRRRLGEPLSDEPEEAAADATAPARPKLSKRADLRPLVRRLYLRPTSSRFETDLWYLWLARLLFPDRYRRMVRSRHCWMIHGDPAERIPRLAVTDKFAPAGGRRVGPMAERQSATRLVDLVTGLFRLCHYYQVLRQAPHGRPCEYKEMGRCSGPCDGTVSLDEYRRQVAEAIDFAADAGRSWRARQADEMAQAARRLDFEAAGRAKDRLARATELDNPRYRWLGDADVMQFLIVQPGRGKAELKTFRAFGGRIVVGPTLARKSPAEKLADWLATPPPADDPQLRAEEAGLLADYLFHSEAARGLFVRYTGQSAADLAAVVSAVFPPTVRKARGSRPGPSDAR